MSTTPQNTKFDVRVSSVFPLTSQGLIGNVEYLIFVILVVPPPEVNPNLRYFIEIHSIDGYFFDNNSIVWTDQELAKPTQLDAGERDTRKIEAYKAAMSNWPPSKSITLKVPMFDKAAVPFVDKYNSKSIETVATMQYDNMFYSKYGVHVSSEDLNIIFHKYFKLSIKS